MKGDDVLMTHELIDPFNRLLGALAAPDAVRSIEAGASASAMWSEIAASGYLDALVPEAQGGAGLTLARVQPLLEAVGRYAVPLPVGETMLARALLAAAGVCPPPGPIALGTSLAQTQIISCGRVAEHVLIDTGSALVLADIGTLTCEETGVHNALTLRISWTGAISGTAFARPDHGLRPIAALLRAALIAGASARLCDLTTEYANTREQFGKPIGRQQALQQSIAVMAEDMIAVRIASQLGCSGGLQGPLHAMATAKSTASSVAARLAATAHAVHGAIGISEDYEVNRLTRRLHEWRMADGSEGYWNALLGAAHLSSDTVTLDWMREHIFAEQI